MCYQHIGQHGIVDYTHVIYSTVKASIKEYMPLFKELKSIGYNLKVMQKASYKKMYGINNDENRTKEMPWDYIKGN